MGAMQPIHWILLLVVVVVLFGGRGKLSGLMGDAAKGIKEFKKGLNEDDTTAAKTPAPEIVERERDKA